LAVARFTGPSHSRRHDASTQVAREPSPDIGAPRGDERLGYAARPDPHAARFADPAEVGNFVAYVASPLASATTGATLRVDGGTVQSTD
jgi:NAD(P)-dependent dehydrogenase (short-subunit alcohol dehydrogenase family)